MKTYTREFKLAVCNEIAQAKLPVERIAKKYNIEPSYVRFWYQVFSIHGNQSFSPRSRPLSVKEKLAIVHRKQTESWSGRHTDAFFNLPVGKTLQWEHEYSSGKLVNSDKPRVKPSMKSKQEKSFDEMSEKELRDELAFLRAENAYLKKLDALLEKKRRSKAERKPK